jgi:hypothetical protein
MSSTRQAVILGPNFTGCGYRFDRTPDHQVLFETGIGPCGAMMFLSRMKPMVGNSDAATEALVSNPFMMFS